MFNRCSVLYVTNLKKRNEFAIFSLSTYTQDSQPLFQTSVPMQHEATGSESRIGPQSRLPSILHHWLCPWLLAAMCSWSHPAILTSEMSYDVIYNLCLFLFPYPLWTTETFSPQIHSSVHFRTKIEPVKVKTCGNIRPTAGHELGTCCGMELFSDLKHPETI